MQTFLFIAKWSKLDIVFKSERLKTLGKKPLLTHNSIIVTEVKKQINRWYS